MTEFIYDYKLNTERSDAFNEGYWDDELKHLALVFKNGSIVVRDLSGWGSAIGLDGPISTGDFMEFDARGDSLGALWWYGLKSAEAVDEVPNTFIARTVADDAEQDAPAVSADGAYAFPADEVTPEADIPADEFDPEFRDGDLNEVTAPGGFDESDVETAEDINAEQLNRPDVITLDPSDPLTIQTGLDALKGDHERGAVYLEITNLTLEQVETVKYVMESIVEFIRENVDDIDYVLSTRKDRISPKREV